MPASMAILLIAGKGFTARSSRSSSISSIICLVRGQLGVGRWMSSPCVAQFFLQFINFTLHVSIILCMRNMALPSRLASTGISCVHTSFMISPMLKVYKPLDSSWCKLASTWCGPIVAWCGPDSSIFSLHWNLLQNRSSSSHRQRQL